jgi:two-component system, OmpR family, sensor kinase
VGRLFWKFFLCILLAQFAATIGIGGTFWLKNRAAQQERLLDIDTSPPAQMAIDAAAATLEFGGSNALRQLLVQTERFRVYAVDGQDRELLGRHVKPATLARARTMRGQTAGRHVVRELEGADGVRLLLFLPYSEHFRGFETGATRDTLQAIVMGDTRAMPSGRPPADAGAPPSSAKPAPFPDMGGMPPGPRMNAPYRSFIPVVAATLASLLFAFLLAWYFARPIRDLRLAFEGASSGDLAPRFRNKPGGDELKDLGHDFDRMTGRLQNMMDSQTRLLHDVSHELRSPLARLQAAIGLAHQQPEKMAASMERIERESVRMDKLIGELLTLSRLEAAAIHPLSEDFSIADLLHDIVEDACYEAGGRQISISIKGDADIGEAIVTGQADLLGRAVENVVRNAIKHSPDGGAVEVAASLLDGGRQVRIAVLDQGPGVAAADLGAIFEPFFRASNTQKSTDGHGLGLAIAQHVIGAHGGTITASNRGSGGLCVEMLLPARMPA